MTEDRSTGAQRARLPIALLDERLEGYRLGWVDDLRYDQRETNGGLRTRAVAWRTGAAEFHLTYHEVPDVPGTAVYRIRTQPYRAGALSDAWQEVATFGDLDGHLRAARKQGAETVVARRAREGFHKNQAPTPEGLILVGLTGSRAYGLAHEGYPHPETGAPVPPSDTDVRGVYVVPTLALLRLEKPAALIEQREAETAYDEVERFLQLCLKGNPERLEMLASPKTRETEEGAWLVAHQRIFLSRQLVKTYGGYSKQQLYRIERKRAGWHKPAMHLIRLLLVGTRALTEGVVDPDVSAHRERLLAIKRGEVPLTEVLAWHRELERAFAQAAEATRLPELPDVAAADRILLAIRRRHLSWDGAADDPRGASAL